MRPSFPNTLLICPFFEIVSDFSGRSLSSAQWQGGTNQRVLLTRQIHTLSHPIFPTKLQRRTSGMTSLGKQCCRQKWSSDVIYITLLLAHREMRELWKCSRRILNLNLQPYNLVTKQKCNSESAASVAVDWLLKDKKNKQTPVVVDQQKQHLTKCLNSVCTGASTWHPTTHWRARAWHWPRQQSVVSTDSRGDQFAPPSFRPFSRVE